MTTDLPLTLRGPTAPHDHDHVMHPRRLAAVYATELLDSPAEEAFDSLTRLAALLTGAPFAFATVVDETRSFWKSTFGLAPDSPRQNTVGESFCQYVVRSQRELIVTDATLDPRTFGNPSVENMGVRAWAGFPLLAPGGHVLGSFCVVDTSPRAWSERDLEVLRALAKAASHEIALRAALGAEHEARERAESLARTLQGSLTPPTLQPVPGIDVGAVFHPAGTGTQLVGDFYDLFRSNDDSWSFVIGDVCGKGVEAAQVATLARYTTGAAMIRRTDPSIVLERLNETLLERSPHPGGFVTAICGAIRIDGERCEVRMACAGHTPPLVRRRDGTVAEVPMRGPLVGVFETYAVGEVSVDLAPGEALVLFTDGVDEARRNGELFGHERLHELLAETKLEATAEEIAASVRDAVLAFCEESPSDDIAVLVVRNPETAD